MKIPALKFSARSQEGLPLCCDLELQTPGDLLAVRGQDLPAIYVVRQEDIGYLRTFTDLVVDRGGKHPARGLSTILLRYDKIPLVRGSYRNPGQLKRSVRTLLANALEARVENIYFIGTEEKVFTLLGEEASQWGGLPLSIRQKGKWLGVPTKFWHTVRKKLRFWGAAL